MLLHCTASCHVAPASNPCVLMQEALDSTLDLLATDPQLLPGAVPSGAATAARAAAGQAGGATGAGQAQGQAAGQEGAAAELQRTHARELWRATGGQDRAECVLLPPEAAAPLLPCTRRCSTAPSRHAQPSAAGASASQVCVCCPHTCKTDEHFVERKFSQLREHGLKVGTNRLPALPALHKLQHACALGRLRRVALLHSLIGSHACTAAARCASPLPRGWATLPLGAGAGSAMEGVDPREAGGTPGHSCRWVGGTVYLWAGLCFGTRNALIGHLVLYPGRCP